MSTRDTDLQHLRISFIEAKRAREHGNHPFGAVLVGPDGEAMIAAENSVTTHKDITAHAELNLVRAAGKKYKPELLQQCTLYASAEPCPMCAGAIVWANIRRVVFGLGMVEIYQLFDPDGASDEPGLKMHATELFRAAPWPVEVIGPLLQEEARAVFTAT